MVSRPARFPGIAVAMGDSGLIAGFTTRTGGCSPHPWDSLNLGLNVSDDVERVARNRGVLARAVGGPVAFATQVHGARVLDADQFEPTSAHHQL